MGDIISAIIGLGSNAINSTKNYEDARKKQGEYDDFIDKKDQMLAKYKALFADALSGKATDADLLALQQMKNSTLDQGTKATNRLNQSASRAGISATGGRNGGIVGSAQGGIQKALNEIYGAQDANLLSTVQNRKDVANRGLMELDASYDQQEAAYEGQYNAAKGALDASQATGNIMGIMQGLGIVLPMAQGIFTDISKASGQDPTLLGQSIKTISDAVGGTIDTVLPAMKSMASQMNEKEFNKAFSEYGITADMFTPLGIIETEPVGNNRMGYRKPIYELKVNPVTGKKERVLTGYEKIAGTSDAEIEAIKQTSKSVNSTGIAAFKALPDNTKNKLIRDAKKVIQGAAKAGGRALDEYQLNQLAYEYVLEQLAKQ